MWTYPDGQGGTAQGPPPIELLDARHAHDMVVQEIEDDVAADLLAEDRGEELLELLAKARPAL